MSVSASDEAIASLHARAIVRARRPGAHLLIAGLTLLLLPTIAGFAPLIPALVVAVAMGAPQDVLVGMLTFWGAMPAIVAAAGVPSGLAFVVAGLEVLRLRDKTRAWIALALALPLALAAATLQIVLTPCTGLLTAALVVTVALWATIRGAAALNDLVLDLGFEADPAEIEQARAALAERAGHGRS